MINPRGYRSKYELIKDAPVSTTTSTNTNINS
jgi:hypothetical protein